jgi:hypothetical protein
VELSAGPAEAGTEGINESKANALLEVYERSSGSLKIKKWALNFKSLILHPEIQVGGVC